MSDNDVSNLRFIGFMFLIVFFSVIAVIFGSTFAKQGQLPTIDELILYSIIGMFVGLGMLFIDTFYIMRKKRIVKNG